MSLEFHPDAFDAAEWRSPTCMARVLLHRHRDLSTVRAMVRNEFGRAPSVEVLARMRGVLDAPKKRQHAASHGGGAINVSNDEHEFDMRMGSRRLLEAIKGAGGC